jgi:hypothetical protein
MPRILKVLTAVTFAMLLTWWPPPPASAQTALRETVLRVVVADPMGAVIVGAKVTAQPIDPAGSPVEAATNERGEAVFGGLLPGRYAVRAEYPGFDPRILDDVRVRAGSNTRREMKLNLAKLAEEVDVGQDPRDRALDPRSGAFSNVLTREQIEALPDDPDEMEEALKQMAGPGAVMRVDGFEAASCRQSHRSSRSASVAICSPQRTTVVAWSTSTSSPDLVADRCAGRLTTRSATSR